MFDNLIGNLKLGIIQKVNQTKDQIEFQSKMKLLEGKTDA